MSSLFFFIPREFDFHRSVIQWDTECRFYLNMSQSVGNRCRWWNEENDLNSPFFSSRCNSMVD